MLKVSIVEASRVKVKYSYIRLDVVENFLILIPHKVDKMTFWT